jgi:arginine deiminase
MTLPNFEIIEKTNNEVLKKVIHLVYNPPIETIELSEPIIKLEKTTSPQSKIEYINTSSLKKFLNTEYSIELFQSVDQIIGLLPHNIYEKLKYDVNLEVFLSWKEKILKNMSLIDNFNIKDIKAEDTKKEGILMIIPSEKQLNVVKGNWDKWVWRKKAYDGFMAPDYNHWIQDVNNISKILLEEGIKVIVVTDNSILNDVLSVIDHKVQVIGIDMPSGLAKIGYSRDQSITFYPNPIIGNMALQIRSGEEEVLNEIYYKLDIPPIIRPRWSLIGNMLVKAEIEGGNIFIIKTDNGIALLTGISVRGTNLAAIKYLGKILPEEIRIIGIPLTGYINDWLTGSVHLDVAFSYLGNTKLGPSALVDPTRMGFYSCLEYNRKTETFTLIEFSKLMMELGIKINEPPRKGQSPITMVNTLNLGNGKIISDQYNKNVNSYIEKVFGIDVIEANIPQIEAGGGGVRCSTREIWNLGSF